MKVVLPYLSNSHVALKSLIESFDHQVITNQPSKKTLSLGVQHSPEFACIPFKILLGTYIEALENGAEMIITSGGKGPCRAGHYGQLHKEILEDLGYEFEMIVFESLTDSFRDFFGKIRKVAGDASWIRIFKTIWREWNRLTVLDKLQQKVHKVRPRELKPGHTTDVFDEVVDLVAQAESIAEIKEAKKQGIDKLEAIPQNKDFEPLKIGIIGEIYVVLEPFANLEVEKVLGEMGVEVDRSIYLSDWTEEHSFFVPAEDPARDAAKPYLDQLIGGHGQESVGSTVLYGQNDYDGVIHLAPFTCIPEIVAKSILPEVSKEEDIPVLTLFLDEKTGGEGIRTRLEAFIDLLLQKQGRKEMKIS
ncbi:2-hydroxyacyl-CoA dehydratase [Natroniella sulfidigena]|uniref:2-hydroxyacyl-CoA dehydratase n=1 Tax=Natroniella sulfidigena TaxID=723921 RepID=UPI00200AEE18|nr:2-hydroxyacyl-CoA dehydratase [Natroniella sulfidigena]MCK8816425.1 2-hydroxyacyl-CoA dehydratase [Natroniella sulfidigena]